MWLLLLLMAFVPETTTLTVSSSEFNDGDKIPLKYTCEGTNINPPLEISDVPKSAKSLVLIVEDPQATNGTFDHWVMWNIPASAMVNIKENSIPGVEGKNTSGAIGYTGPCPPNGKHHYHFKVYALDTMLDIKSGFDKSTLQAAIAGHIVATGELDGSYEKKK